MTREFPLLTSLSPFSFLSHSHSLSLSLPPSLSLSLSPSYPNNCVVCCERDRWRGGEGGEREREREDWRKREREVVLLYCTSCLPVGVALVCCVCLLTEYCVSAYWRGRNKGGNRIYIMCIIFSLFFSPLFLSSLSLSLSFSLSPYSPHILVILGHLMSVGHRVESHYYTMSTWDHRVGLK